MLRDDEEKRGPNYRIEWHIEVDASGKGYFLLQHLESML
jgi:hypothetical protein